MQSSGDTTAEALHEVKKEIAILRACRDPNIVGFAGALVSEKETLLVTEVRAGAGGDWGARHAQGRAAMAPCAWPGCPRMTFFGAGT